MAEILHPRSDDIQVIKRRIKEWTDVQMDGYMDTTGWLAGGIEGQILKRNYEGNIGRMDKKMADAWMDRSWIIFMYF